MIEMYKTRISLQLCKKSYVKIQDTTTIYVTITNSFNHEQDLSTAGQKMFDSKVENFCKCYYQWYKMRNPFGKEKIVCANYVTFLFRI